MTEWCVWSQNPLIQKTARGDWGATSALSSDLPAAARDCSAGGIDALNNSDTVFVADFLRELFGNIARYDDPTQRYVVLVSAAQDRVTIDVTDRPRQGDATFEGAAFRACVLSGACAACAWGLGCAGETRAVGTACFSAGR